MSDEIVAPLPRRKKRIHRAHPPKIGVGAVKNEINVTPLVDVVLVLLIIFMVVTPMLNRGKAIELPQTSHHEKRNDTGEQIMVSVDLEGNVYLDADKLPADGIVDSVREALGQRRPDGTPREVHVRGDRRLTYGEVRKVLEKIHEAGAPAVALGSEELKKESK